MPAQISRILRFWFVLVVALFTFTRSAAQAPTTSLALSSEQRAQLHNLVSHALSHANQVRCKASRCDVLVANFTDQKGSTSVLGMQLAEEVSKDDSFAASHIRTTPRSMLQSYLESQRIPSRALKEAKAMCWLAREMSADAVLVGQLRVEGNSLKLELQLLESNYSFLHNAHKSKVERGVLGGIANSVSLSPAEPFGDLPDVYINGEKISKLKTGPDADQSNMTTPVCTYKPDPPYSEYARQSRFQGTVILQTVISKDGVMADVRPLAGAPYGLTAVSVATVRTWKCRPSKIDGTPVSALVPIEISFRLF